MKELTIGTTVQLKTGGPKMTVAGKGTIAGSVVCIWFDKDGKKSADQFSPDKLDVVRYLNSP